MGKDLRIGLIGPGHIANKMASTIKNLPGFCNYAVASRSKEKADAFKEKYGFQKAYYSYEDMLKDENVDLVYISTPHSVHLEQMELCLKYKKPVLCEKALTTSLKDTESIYKKFEEAGVFISEALWTSFMPSRQYIHHMLYEKKKIGNIQSMTAKFMVPLMHKERVTSRALGGGVLMDIGIYPVSFVFRTLGFDYDSYDINNITYKNGVDIKEDLTFNYKNGVKGICKVDGTTKLTLTVKIQGDKGTMNIDMVNCPNVITTFNKCKILTSCKITKPKYGGFEYELIACKKALEDGKLECNEWTHQNSIAFAKIIEDLFNCEEATK
ncbi:MAG: Gfo/Idh/MocA family oxidoreductase [Clostridiales bacterium]|nr:Gfo/Idh/MocA family oxidoreductase [Clostridiales bacterium]